MKIKFLDNISKKVGGNENLMMILLGILIIILLVVIFRLNYLIDVFQNMCFFEYKADYICSCVGKSTNLLKLANLSFSP